MDERLKKIVDETDNIVFFGGAGVSTESNVPDFRSKDGLYNAQEKYGYRPETMLSHSFYEKHTKTFFEYYKENLIHTEAKPNDAHKALAKLEKMGKMKAVVTQNIDGLHQAAGSKNVFELHGTVHKNHCTKCGKFFDLDWNTSCAAATGATVEMLLKFYDVKSSVIYYKRRKMSEKIYKKIY